MDKTVRKLNGYSLKGRALCLEPAIDRSLPLAEKQLIKTTLRMSQSVSLVHVATALFVSVEAEIGAKYGAAGHQKVYLCDLRALSKTFPIKDYSSGEMSDLLGHVHTVIHIVIMVIDTILLLVCHF